MDRPLSRQQVDDEVTVPAASVGLENSVVPDDSVSTVSAQSSVSSRLKLAAKAAKLKAEAAALKEKHKLEIEKQRLNHRLEELELETQIAVATSEAEVYDQEVGKVRPEASEPNYHESDGHELSYALNPSAPEWTGNSVPVVPAVDQLVPVSGEGQVNIGRQYQQLIAAVNMPHMELMHFDGNPLEYWTFIRAFENSVEKVCDDSVSRLTRLLQYCTGKAKRVIQCCAVMNPDDGYRKAHELLKQRFGDSYVIAEAWLKKVTEGKVVGAQEAEALQELADDLSNCKQTFEAMNYLSEINTQGVLAKIVRRLPAYLQNRWIREVRETRVKQKRTAGIQDLVTFVTAAAEEANDPVYSRLRDDSKPKQRGVWRKERGHSFSVVTEPLKCVMCSGNHNIFQCRQFRESSPEVRS